jgi:hypothetical protein
LSVEQRAYHFKAGRAETLDFGWCGDAGPPMGLVHAAKKRGQWRTRRFQQLGRDQFCLPRFKIAKGVTSTLNAGLQIIGDKLCDVHAARPQCDAIMG